MNKWTVEYLRENNLIAYEYIRGSKLYKLNLENGKSDTDIGGVFICPPEMLLGLRSNYVEQVSDENNDTVFYEFGRWLELLVKSNPTVLESLFVPKRCIIGSIHPAVQHILDHRDSFLTKECFKHFYQYAHSQISKCRGLNKKIVNPVTERKGVMDFCYTFSGQGSVLIKEYLSERGLDQKYCGLVNIPNMRDVYGVYYDFAAWFCFEGKSEDELSDILERVYGNDYLMELEKVRRRVSCREFLEYEGIVNPDDVDKSNEVRLCSVPKGEKAICQMYYNKDAYTIHCKDYREYKEWEAKRNPVRYEGNLGHNYDAKNVMHCMRLIRMAKEIAKGKGFNVERTDDRQYLLDIRNHKFEYEEIIAHLEQEQMEFEEAAKTCTLPECVDVDMANRLLIEARNLR